MNHPLYNDDGRPATRPSVGAPLRLLLRGAAKLYGTAIRVRNRRFDRTGPDTTLELPVISVGNVTVGGTGKTPMVLDLVARLRGMGARPAVLARGYGAAKGAASDEEMLIRDRFPDVSYLADPDRRRSGLLVQQQGTADVVVLDDGFQHRRLGRDLDIVMVDATCPFGHEQLLPAGLLREPPGSLARADVIVLSRVDQAPASALDEMIARLRTLAPQATLLRACHRVTRVDELGTGNPCAVDGARVVLFAAIARPSAFRATVESLGATVCGARWWPDHYRYAPADLQQLRELLVASGAERLLVTEKDAVKLRGVTEAADVPIGVVRIAIDFLDEDATLLDAAIRRTLGRRGGVAPATRPQQD